MKEAILSDAVLAQLANNVETLKQLPELNGAIHRYRDTLARAAAKRCCRAGLRSQAQNTLKQAVVALPADKKAVVKQLLGVDAVSYYTRGLGAVAVKTTF